MSGRLRQLLVVAGSFGVFGAGPRAAVAMGPGDPIEVPDGTAAILSTERAAEKRAAIREGVASDRAAKRFRKVGQSLERDAAMIGDPLTLLDAGEAWLEAARVSRDKDEALHAEELTLVALDILHFYRDVAAGKTRSRWSVVTGEEAADGIERSDAQLEAVRALIEEIENPPPPAKVAAREGAATKKRSKTRKPRREKKPREPRERKPGTGMLAAGSVMTIVGAGGGGLALAGLIISTQKQREVETLDAVMDAERVEQLDREGARANLMAYIGIGVAGGALAIGIPLLAVGAKKRKVSQSAATSWRVVPNVSASHQGVVFSGRF